MKFLVLACLIVAVSARPQPPTGFQSVVVQEQIVHDAVHDKQGAPVVNVEDVKPAVAVDLLAAVEQNTQKERKRRQVEEKVPPFALVAPSQQAGVGQVNSKRIILFQNPVAVAEVEQKPAGGDEN